VFDWRGHASSVWMQTMSIKQRCSWAAQSTHSAWSCWLW
jgi:hypothetical protein